jgi:hypothetical protein
MIYLWLHRVNRKIEREKMGGGGQPEENKQRVDKQIDTTMQ